MRKSAAFAIYQKLDALIQVDTLSSNEKVARTKASTMSGEVLVCLRLSAREMCNNGPLQYVA